MYFIGDTMAWGGAKATWIVNGDWPQQPYIVACCVFRSSARYTGYTVHTSISKVTLVSKRDTHSWYMLPWPFRLHVHVHVHVHVALLPHCYLTEAAVSIKWCVYVYTHTHTHTHTMLYLLLSVRRVCPGWEPHYTLQGELQLLSPHPEESRWQPLQ